MRTCACGCGLELPAGKRAGARYVNPDHYSAAYHRGEPFDAAPRLCACGCRRPVASGHRRAKYATERCKRLCHPPRLPGLDPRWWPAVLSRDPCAYCGRSSEVLDHITPRAHDGDDTAENLTAACAACNGAKQDRPLLRFLLRGGMTA